MRPEDFSGVGSGNVSRCWFGPGSQSFRGTCLESGAVTRVSAYWKLIFQKLYNVINVFHLIESGIIVNNAKLAIDSAMIPVRLSMVGRETLADDGLGPEERFQTHLS
ncbi:hypothetical protein CEXT_761291 [Caerostris extrusa]|uniref:Uncharacterized protein n=1 Tax=Caerostris extrusa TaxID=172846 RepID=A0AAV4SFA1_CAEEX|nr:hypothetical protein CEXT_761291 [Caerostris extrusa]